MCTYLQIQKHKMPNSFDEGKMAHDAREREGVCVCLNERERERKKKSDKKKERMSVC